MVRTTAVLNAFVLLEAIGVLAFSSLADPRPLRVSPVGEIRVDAPPPAGTQPPGSQPAPVAVDIPRIGVRSDLVRLDVDPTGALEAPDDFAKAGWWAAGPVPGATGAAVLVGHLDSHRGPAVFFRVPSLVPGDTVNVRRADGTTASFVVDAVRQYNKDALPARQIYGSTAGPELRLITCGGTFDERTKSYADNIVVFAHLGASHEAPSA